MSKKDVERVRAAVAPKEVKEAEKAARAEARERAKLEKAAQREAEKEAKKVAKAAREATPKPQFTHTMEALREAKKLYVKSTTGQFRSTDPVAVALDTVPPTKVVELAIRVLGLPKNPYAHLNVGQQSMNLRNRLRFAIKSGTKTLQELIDVRDAGAFAMTDDEVANVMSRREKSKARAAA